MVDGWIGRVGDRAEPCGRHRAPARLDQSRRFACGTARCTAALFPFCKRGCPVSNPDRYRQNAIDCLRLANETRDPGAKAVLLDMAQSWVRLADQAQKNLRTDLVYETPPRVPADDPPAKPSPD